ncbi:MAG: hypothetical protein KF784_01160 [Fimbriimonadaceae bacterium]|nr:hypothetical protein [Fimbriimonadaceae bacterium]
MPDLLVVSSFQFLPVFLSQATRMPMRARELLMEHEGVKSYTAWQDPSDPAKLTTILWVEGDEIADEIALTMSQNSFYAEALKTFTGPADMKRVRITTTVGKSIDDTDSGDYLSISHRIAEPGMMDEMEDELEGIFQDLQTISGFIGSMHGPNAALDEEMIALAFWADEASYRKSLPRKMMYSIGLTRRIV